MKIDLKEMGRRIREIRGDLSLDDFEAILGVSRSSISLYERGESWPKPETLSKIVAHGKVTYEWLLTGKEPEPKKEVRPAVTLPLDEKERGVITTVEDLLKLYGLSDRFALIEIGKQPEGQNLTGEERRLLGAFRQMDPALQSALVRQAELTVIGLTKSQGSEEKEKDLKERKSA